MSVGSRIAYLEKRLAVEVGPRGGKIIGQTKSGKPIYDDANHESHKNFDHADHMDAMKLHQQKALEAQNHKPFGFLHNPEIKKHQDQATQHYLKTQHRQVAPRPGSKAATLESRLAEVGPHGGKIVGKTKKGKPIYESASAEHAHANHPHFTPEDHEEARAFHAAKAGEQVHKMRMGDPQAKHEYKRQNDMAGHHVAAKYTKALAGKQKLSFEILEKRLAEIGPRGGKIIGKTKSGKNIYDTANHEAHKDFTAGDHKDAMNLHADNFSKLKNHPLAAIHGDLIDHHAKEYMRHHQKLKNLTNPEPAVYDLTKDFQKN